MTHKDLAKLARDSYDHKGFNIGECELIIQTYADVQIVAFRGTEAGSLFGGSGWIDVLRDMRLMPWYDKDAGWCHAGFLKGGRKTAKFLAGELDRNKPVILTGHSLGGALALMCAVKLHATGFLIEEWVGFASPKCQLTKKRYRFRQINYRHRGDIVPLMPGILFYRHNYPVIWLSPELGLIPTWRDHHIDYYVQKVA